jgi:VWFA-related protein
MRFPNRLAAPLAALLLAGSATYAQATPQQPQEPAPGRIRVAVDVVAVDVQVLDRSGRPVPGLGPEKFTVTINGRRRRVVSAEQIGSDAEGHASSGNLFSATVPARVIMLAIDCISFDATASREVIQSVAGFVRGLQPDDHVGMSAYPNGAQIAPTTDHGAVLRALNTVVGQRDSATISQFHLRPSEIIDLSRDISMGGGPTLDAVVDRECGQEGGGPNCRFQLVTEVTNAGVYYEGQATASLGMLRNLVTQMQGYPGRKTLLLVSGGMIASDRPGGRPDLASMGIYVGQAAAAANTAIYTLFLDTSLHDRFAAETRRGYRTQTNRDRDSAVMARWLEQFTGSAGGALFPVHVGNAAPVLQRIQTELTSYYLLGVEPADEDRDGRTHAVAVKVTQPDVTIRGRRWVMIPKRGLSASAPAPAAAAPGPSAPASPLPAEPAPRVAVPPDVVSLADVFDRGKPDAFQKALADADLERAIRGFRQSDGPWPQNRRRTAVFALELGLAGLRSDIRATREEAGRLLAEYHTRVREPAGADAFECLWFVAEAAALEGLFAPESAQPFIARSLLRCPDNPRLHLAHAFVLEQQWLRGRTTPAQAPEILTRYEAAMKFPETETEARVRAARFLHAQGQLDRALAMVNGVTRQSPDLEIRYFEHLIRGQILKAAGRQDEAAASFQAALTVWPGAQSARVALMTLLLGRGNRAEAAALSEAIQTAPPDQSDPWWMYWLGDYRVYPAISDRLRQAGQ